jgi:hypothetical protein
MSLAIWILVALYVPTLLLAPNAPYSGSLTTSHSPIFAKSDDRSLPYDTNPTSSTTVYNLEHVAESAALYRKDSSHVYCLSLFDSSGKYNPHWQVVSNEPKSYVALSSEAVVSPFSKDDNHVYIVNCWSYNGYPAVRIISGANPDSFRVIGNSWTTNGDFLTGVYAADATNIYFLDNGNIDLHVTRKVGGGMLKIIKGNPEYDATDGSQYFSNGILIGGS